MHSVDITDLLKKMCKNSYLESDNNGRWTIYKLNLKVDTSNTKVDTSNTKVDTSSNTKIDTAFDRKVDTSFDRKVDTSDRKVDTSDTKVDTSAINEKAVIRLSKEELEQLIMRVCKNNYVKMEEIATIVCKSVDYLKNKIVPTMIKDGKLEKRYPYTHNHPEQGYKTGKDYLKEL
jgi:hypothetical protein